LDFADTMFPSEYEASMNRRDFIGAIGVAAVTLPRSASAETQRTLGLLMPFSDGNPFAARLIETLRQSLAGFGWREGSNLRLETRWGQDDGARLLAYAKELAGKQPDVILAHGPAFRYAHEATRTIPIVFTTVSDPVGQGFVSSLAHPGGNATGFELVEFSVGGKLIELLKEIAPDTKRVMVIGDPSNSSTPQWWRSIEGAGRDIGIEPQQALVSNDDDIDAAIAAVARTPYGGIVVPPQAFATVHRDRIMAAAARWRLPAVYYSTVLAREGGLISYGPDLTDQYVRAAAYIDRILKGEKPNDLPVQGPIKFELAVNLKTAKSLGITVPPSLLARADEVIE
jgi:putative tryptophan/tyrosine transport system substrate-binding protein